ncbi:MAG: NTP transferase domain-containing protein [Leptospiraceae bacterium]|nr:NTP transferase domain-containing protein [Leptospiraceae bacterium]
MASSSSNRMAVILAAGKGTRMKSELPKVALSIAGKPMIEHVLENLRSLNLSRIAVVVGYRKEEVINRIDLNRFPQVVFAEQTEQKGTAHALLAAKEAIGEAAGTLLVTSGDMPLIQPETFEQLFQSQENQDVAACVLSAIQQDPTGYGRLVRDNQGFLERIVEEKDADEETKKIKESNAGTYVFESPDIFSVLTRIDSENKQNEYYLPDAVKVYRTMGRKIGTLVLDDSDQTLGANTVDELASLETKFQKMQAQRQAVKSS